MDEFNLLATVGQSLNNKNLQEISSRTKVNAQKKADVASEKLADLEKGAKAFESYFIHSLLKEMRKSVKTEGNGSLGYSEGIYQSMFDEAIAEKISENGGIGLADILIKNLSKNLKFLGKSTDKGNE